MMLYCLLGIVRLIHQGDLETLSRYLMIISDKTSIAEISLVRAIFEIY